MKNIHRLFTILLFLNLSETYRLLLYYLNTPSIVIFLFKSPVANFVYPKLSADKKTLIAVIFSINMAGFIFNSANQAINMANIAFKATSVLIRISVIKTVINFVFDIILGFKFGVIGIAFSTVLVHLCGLIINYFVFNKKVLPKMTASVDPIYN